MILSDDELDARLTSDINLVNRIQVVITEDMRGKVGKRGDEIPPLVRELLAITANTTTEYQKDVASVFGVNPPEISTFSRGLVHTEFDPSLAAIGRKAAENKEADAHSLAVTNLMSALEQLAPKLTEVVDPKMLSKISVDMSRVVGSLKAKRDESDGNKPIIIIHSVAPKTEKAYDYIDV